MPYSATRPRRSNSGNFNRSSSSSFGGGRSSGGRGSSFGGGGRRGPKKDYIHPSRFVKVGKPIEEQHFEPMFKFADFEINDILKRNILNKGFTLPSPIQDQTIPLGLAGKDVIGVANTGTGKTIAFAIPVLNRMMADKNSRTLIVAPTRELAQQIDDECRVVAKGSGLCGAILIGGTAMGPQLRDLNANPSIVIGTPGRIKDHIERGSLKLGNFNMVVLDEVDRMLDMGFLPDVTEILSRLSKPRQSFFFSATLDSKVRELIQTFSDNPVTISVKTGDTAESVHQDIVPYETSRDKIDQLHDILLRPEMNKTIIFDDTQRSVERLSNDLIERGFKADAIHGGKSQGQRQRALKRFKDGQISVLVATDVAARGIDVTDISHVINFSTPSSYEDYVHRIGRAGRAGRVGYALTFVEHR